MRWRYVKRGGMRASNEGPPPIGGLYLFSRELNINNEATPRAARMRILRLVEEGQTEIINKTMLSES